MKKIVVLLMATALLSCQKEKNAEKQGGESLVENVSSEHKGDLNFNMEKTKLTWTAYKTPDKIGVEGSFRDIEVSDTKVSANAEKVLSEAKFKIDASKVTTNNEDRDAKIAKLFFGNLEEMSITGDFGVFKDGVVPVTMTMNENTVTKDFTYSVEGTTITINGKIDMIADFKSNKGFDALHEACKQLHLNKTWTDVSISIVTELE